MLPPRGAPSQGQPGLLPGTMAAAGPPDRTDPVQLPPVTSLLERTETVLQTGGATGQAGLTQSVTDPLPAAELPPVAESTETPPVTATPPVVATLPVTETPPVTESGPVVIASTGQQEQQPPANEIGTPGVNMARTEAEPSPRMDQPEPVTQQTEPETPVTPVIAETEPAARQLTESSVLGTPVPADDQTGQMQTPTPIVTRPRRKRQMSSTSAPGDVGPGEAAFSSASGRIYHTYCQSRVIRGCGLQIRTRRSARRSAPDPVQRGWRGTATGCRRRPGVPRLVWTRRPARSTRPTGMRPSTPSGRSKNKACGRGDVS